MGRVGIFRARRGSVLITSYFAGLERELKIVCDSSSVSRYFDTCFARVKLNGPSRSVPLDEAELVYERGTPALVLNKRPVDLGDPTVLAGSAYDFAFSASHRAFRQSFAENKAWFNFHAAAIEVGGRAVVIVGAPGSGKTMLALALVARGARLYSDEFVFIRRSDRMVSGLLSNPFLREPAVRALGYERLSQLCVQTAGRRNRRGLHTWYEFTPEAIFDRDVTATAAPLAYLLVLDPTAIADRPIRMSSTVAAVDLARRLNAPIVGFERLGDIADIMRDIPAFRMSVGTAAGAAAAILDHPI